MKTHCKGFTLVEIMIAVVLIGFAAVAISATLSTVSIARLRTEINSEVRSWHHNYAISLSKGDVERTATSVTAPVVQTFTLPSGISVTVTDSFSAPDAAFPSLLVITSVATWSVPNGTGTGSETITLSRMTQAGTL